MINKIANIIKSTDKPFMDFGVLFKDNNIKYDFSLAGVAHYTIKDKGKEDIIIVNKKHIDGLLPDDFVIGDYAIGRF